MGFDLNTFVQIIVDGHRIIMPEVPAVDCTQSLKILAENNIIVVGRMRLNPVIDSDKVTEIRCGAVVTFACTTGILKSINDAISIILTEELLCHFQANCIQFVDTFLGQLQRKNRSEERGSGVHGVGGGRRQWCAVGGIMHDPNRAPQPPLGQWFDWHTAAFFALI